MSDGLDIHVLRPETWKERVSDLDLRHRRILDAAHDHHIPMTPGLAARLDAGARGVSGEPGQAVFDAACKVLGQRVQRRQFVNCRFEILFDFLLAPLLRRAAAECGRSVLYGAVALNPIGRAENAAWERDMETALRGLIEDPDRMGRSFWTVAGFAVLGDLFAQANRGRAGAAASAQGATAVFAQEPDPVMAWLIADVEPEFDRRADALMRAKIARRPEPRRSGIKPREGGIEGVLLSRSLDDVDEILPSEFCKPKELLTVKLAEEGFLIKHRPPFRKPRRDLLVAVLIPEDAETQGPMLLRAAVIDMVARLWLLLGHGAAPRIDIALVREQLGRTQASAARIDHLPPVARRKPFHTSRDTRLTLVLKTNLLPAAIDRLPNGPPLAGGPLADGFVAQALGSVGRVSDRSGQAAKRQGERRVALGGYRTVLAVAAVPKGGTGFLGEATTGKDAAAALLTRLWLPPSVRGIGVHIGCPVRPDLGDGYEISVSDGRTLDPVEPGEGSDDRRIAQMIGRLSLVLIERIYEALNDG